MEFKDIFCILFFLRDFKHFYELLPKKKEQNGKWFFRNTYSSLATVYAVKCRIRTLDRSWSWPVYKLGRYLCFQTSKGTYEFMYTFTLKHITV